MFDKEKRLAYWELMRFNRPIGAWLLLLPCFWGLFMGSSKWPSGFYCSLFFLGAFVMRAAGCIYNDIVDVSIDRQVERTRERPIARGAIKIKEAALLFILLLVIGAVILSFLPMRIHLYAYIALVLVFIYPWMKRITYWPQAFLGLTFNSGVLIAWGCVRDTFTLSALLLYIAGIFWTLGFDTIYGYQDCEDDALIGIKSTPLKFRERGKIYIGLFYLLSTLSLILAGWYEGLSLFYYLGLIFVALHYAWQVGTLNLKNVEDCLAKFKSNQWVGWLILSSIIAAKMLP